MYECFHSGLEAYCKKSAQLLEDSNNIDGWLPLCKDILPDRSDKNLTKAWTYSNERKGRSCRPAIFEKCWLDVPCNVYIDEANMLAHDIIPAEGFITIDGGSEYERDLSNTKRSTERKLLAQRKCEEDAVHACVQHLVDAARSDRDDTAFVTCSLVYKDEFPLKFFSTVLPAIERGFVSERYHPTVAHQFTLTINEPMLKAHIGIRQNPPTFEKLTEFLTILVSGLIYGPDHPLATSSAWNATGTYTTITSNEGFASTNLRITQVFDNNSSYEGYSVQLTPDQALFFGRSANVEDFYNACDKLFGKNSVLANLIKSKTAIQFPISEVHEAVSIKHGMLLFQGDEWRYYDLNSSNGTSIKTAQDRLAIDATITIRPGDVLRLGAPPNTDDANDASIYLSAAAIRVTCYVDRELELFG